MPSISIDVLPHRPPMRLVEEIIEVVPGESARARRVAHPGDWYFQGHFPDDPIVPAIVLVELLAQTGGIAACSRPDGTVQDFNLRVAEFTGFKFPTAARPNDVLDAAAHVVGRMGRMVRIEGEVTVRGKRVAVGGVTLAWAAEVVGVGLETRAKERQ